jgi:hypothetical protein
MAPRAAARLAGLLYLVVIVCGAFAEAGVRQRLMVHGDAAATAANIVANAQLYRWGFVADLVPLLCNMVLAVIFYRLFAPVNRGVAALVVLFSVVGSAIQASALLYHLEPLMLLTGGSALAAIPAAQLQAMAYFALRMQVAGYNIALVFFGCFGLSLGWLIWRSRFLPRLLGVLMAIAGACYFTNAMLGFVAPPLASMLLLLPCLIGEGGLTLWLLIAGVDPAKWEARVAAQS